MRRGLPIALLALSLLPLLAPSPGQGQKLEKVRFATPLRVSPYLGLPAVATQERGFWKEQGLEAEWIAFASGGAMAKAMAGGHVDFAIHGTSSAIMEIVRGVPQIIVAEMEARYDFMIFVPAKSAIAQPAQLKGAKIGVIGFGSLAEIFGKVVTKELGLQKEVKFVALGGTPSMVAGLKAGVVDGMLTTLFGVAPLAFKGEIRQVLVVTDFLPKNWSEIVIPAQRAFFEKNPQTIARGVRAIIQAGQFIVNNRAWTVEKTIAEFRYTREAAEGIFPILRYSSHGRINKAALENVTNLLIEYGLVLREKAPPVDQMFTRQVTG